MVYLIDRFIERRKKRKSMDIKKARREARSVKADTSITPATETAIEDKGEQADTKEVKDKAKEARSVKKAKEVKPVKEKRVNPFEEAQTKRQKRVKR